MTSTVRLVLPIDYVLRVYDQAAADLAEPGATEATADTLELTAQPEVTVVVASPDVVEVRATVEMEEVVADADA